MTASKQCPICHGRDFKLIATKIREGEGRIVRCTGCQLTMQDLNWSQEEVSRYYNEDYQRTNSLVHGETQTARQHFDDRIKNIDHLFQQVKPLLRPSMDVLDVGCGAGELLSVIKPHVKRCAGVEMNKEFTDFMEAELGIEARAGDLLEMNWGGREFDLITCVDSLDHMANPLEVLVKMRNLLAPGGSIWLAVPNLNDVLNTYLPETTRAQFQEFFWHRAHFFYFNAETLAGMLKAAGFKAEKPTYYHAYTLKNFLRWYFLGKPQKSYVEAGTSITLFGDADAFEKDMNRMFTEMEGRFHEILRETGRGDTLCCQAVPISAAVPASRS